MILLLFVLFKNRFKKVLGALFKDPSNKDWLRHVKLLIEKATKVTKEPYKKTTVSLSKMLQVLTVVSL